MNKSLKIIECPRDAMQGWADFISTDKKIDYINSLLQVGFDAIDFGSFVSPKAIPQMRDTAQVLDKLKVDSSTSRLLAIVANLRGAEEASSFDQITYLGYPFSVSEEFQRRNTNASIAASLSRVEEIQRICIQRNKKLVIYISMGFGNPYGEPWSPEIVTTWVSKLAELGINIIALADTVGVSSPENISLLFNELIPALPGVEFGAHLHSHPFTWKEKVEAAFHSGCSRFDAALNGIGGCPMAEDKLVGNLATENLIGYFGGTTALNLNTSAFENSLRIASELFHG